MTKQKVVLIIMVILVVTIIVQNMHPSTFTIFFIDVTMPQIVYTLMVLVAGFVIGFICGKMAAYKSLAQKK